MPLLKGKSKKDFSKNVETEMDAGKPQKQALAIAYGVKRRSKPKKMAKGGEITADTKKRPMPDQTFDDKAQTSRTVPSKKASGWLDNKKEAGKSGPTKPNQADEDFVTEDMTDTEKARTVEEMNMVEGPSTDPKKVNANHKKDMPKMLAKGGPVNFSNEARANENSKDSMEFDMETSSSDPQHINANHKKDMPQMLAEGGDVEEHYASIADAILAKKRRAMPQDGRADVSLNAVEEPNNLDDANFDALRKENYSESAGLDQMDSPMDSGQHGDKLSDEDENGESIIDAIRRKRKSK